MRRLTREERTEAIVSVALVTALLAGYAIVTAIDDAADAESARNAQTAEWLRKDCIPKNPGERAVAEMREDGTTSCVIHSNIGYGRAPSLISAEVRS